MQVCVFYLLQFMICFMKMISVSYLIFNRNIYNLVYIRKALYTFSITF